MVKWLAFANDVNTFDVIKCFQESKICHWKNYSFSKDDIVYIYVKSLQCIKYKTVVICDKVEPKDWPDDKFWIRKELNTDKENRVLLELCGECDQHLLTISALKDHGLKTTQSLSRPNKNPPELIEFIDSVFNKYLDELCNSGELYDIEKFDELSPPRWVKVNVDRYERDPDERRKCIQKYGNKYECIICGFNFEKVYGDIGHNYIQVHHINPLSNGGQDISGNMIPVCPNCHAMLHVGKRREVRDYNDLMSRFKKEK